MLPPWLPPSPPHHTTIIATLTTLLAEVSHFNTGLYTNAILPVRHTEYWYAPWYHALVPNWYSVAYLILLSSTRYGIPCHLPLLAPPSPLSPLSLMLLPLPHHRLHLCCLHHIVGNLITTTIATTAIITATASTVPLSHHLPPPLYCHCHSHLHYTAAKPTTNNTTTSTFATTIVSTATAMFIFAK